MFVFPNGSEQYVCLTYNNSTLAANLYTNGVLGCHATIPTYVIAPGNLGGAGGTTQNDLGNDMYGDWQFNGTIYEFRIWNGALSPVYLAVSAVAGPSVVVTNLTPSSVSVTVTNTSMIGAQTQPGHRYWKFRAGIRCQCHRWRHQLDQQQPKRSTVNSSGLITALSGGTATVSATVNGVTGTTATITVADTQPTVQGPVNLTVAVGDTAYFSIQALGGGLSYQWSFNSSPIANATNTSLTVTNVGFTNAGTYSILVSNNLGSTNASATLTVQQAVLEHRYSFVSDASDSVGGPTWNGTLVAPNGGSAATINNGLILPGHASGGFGYAGYVSFPSGILTNTTSLTVECWTTQNSANQWAEIWDFGNSGSQNFGLIPDPANNSGNMEVAFTPHGNEVDLQSAVTFPNSSEQYVALTFNAASLMGDLYSNGVLVATQTFPDTTYTPGTIGGAAGTTENMLGNDVYGDDQFSGTVYEFRIWDGAVSPLYLTISAAAGPGVVVTNLTPTSVNVTVTTSMIQGQTQQAAVVGNFVNASGITVTAVATNWISSNPGALTVNSSGLITAVGTGSATISATVNGVTGTSASITVPTSAPVITQQPEAAKPCWQARR